jgi:ketosteroid isomerase-like protein
MKRTTLILAALAVLLMAQAAGRAQSVPQGASPVRGPEADILDFQISEMLAAWQVGDAEALKAHYAENAVVVSGVYEPPIIGRASFLAAYSQQRARMQQVRVERRNTVITVRGNIAWMTYQWEFGALVDGRGVGYRGHTSLVLEKSGNRWLIVHNHTSVVQEVQPEPAPKP